MVQKKQTIKPVISSLEAVDSSTHIFVILQNVSVSKMYTPL